MRKSTRKWFGILSVCFFTLFVMLRRGMFDELLWGDEIREQQKREENMQNLMNSDAPIGMGFEQEFIKYMVYVELGEIEQNIEIGDNLLLQDEKENYEVTIQNIFSMERVELSELQSEESQMVYVRSSQELIGDEETQKQFVILDEAGNEIGKGAIQNIN